jgi:phosphate uptake regulator
METRRIQLTGKRSYSISLPKEWIVKNNLKEKSTIFTEEIGERELLIKADSNNNSNKKVSIELNKIEDIEDFFAFCYLKNIKKIDAKFGKDKDKELKQIKKILKYLKGYEIIYQDKEKIEVSFLFEETDANINEIIKRIISLLNTQIELLDSENKEEIEETEQSIDALHFLGKRTLYLAARKSKVMKNNSIHGIDEVFLHIDLIKKLERIGDVLYSLRERKIKKDELEKLRNIFGYLDNFYSLDKQNISLSLKNLLIEFYSKETKKSFERINHLFKDVARVFISININRNLI